MGIQGGVVRKRQYFTPQSVESCELLSGAEFFAQLSETFVRILPRYFHGSVALSLTGGLDTRMILAARRPEPGELPCYTFAGSYRDTLDLRIAARVAQACDQPHFVLRLDDNRFLADYPLHLAQSVYYTDGLGSVNTADVIALNRRARTVAPVRITGKYGSQVLKSVSGFKARPPIRELIRDDFRAYLDLACKTMAAVQQRHSLSAMLSQEIPWWWNGFLAAESSQVTVGSPFLDNDLVDLLYRAPSRAMDAGSEFQLDFIRRRDPRLALIPTGGGRGGSTNPVISATTRCLFWLLNAADKVYMRERLPFGLTHWFARVDRVLSAFGLDRLVMGFGTHRRYRVWFRRSAG